MNSRVKIGDLTIGYGLATVFVAEVGINHLGDLQLAKDMIRAAYEAGSDFIKLQTYLPEKRYDPSNSNYEAFTRNLTDWHLSKDAERELWQYGNQLGARVFTSVFDEESVEFARELGTLAYKLAAFEIVNEPLLKCVIKQRLPVIFSRGMATDEEVDHVVELLVEADVPHIILHTISSYPLPREQSHLRKIHALRDRYDCPIGHSDHTWGADVPPLAVAAGACMIEKHFTTKPKRRESDNFFSVTPEIVREIKFRIAQVDRVMGDYDMTISDEESYMWEFRRVRPSDD